MASSGISQIQTKFDSKTSRGKEFWLAVPLNDAMVQPTVALEFYVTSSYTTNVTFEVPGTGFSHTKLLKSNSTISFSTNDGSASFDLQVESSQIADKRGVHIYADQPISVYVMNAKQYSAEGYLALPVNALGTRYIHCSYYDFNEVRPWSGGFIVVATEDNTSVTINLNGRGKTVAKTRSGSKIGDVLGPIILNKGDVYNVVGDGTTKGIFDLSGSEIISNKPVGLISYHERTMIPSNVSNGRDHLCEMLHPVSTWGRKYNSIELERANKGDFYRVVASSPNTACKMKYYDKTTKALLGQRDIVLSKTGDFFEDFNTSAGSGNITGFNGITVWEADKPILVMQYAYSSDWDNGTMFDPFMIALTPQEQYQKSVAFRTPTNSVFQNNYFNFIIEGDAPGTEQTKLKSFVLDGDSVYKSYPELLTNNIPNTNLYWGRRPVKQGQHLATSNTVLSGFVYGFGMLNSYGWPVETGVITPMTSISGVEIDTLPPVLSYKTDCGDYYYVATELREIDPDSNYSRQIDQGIFDIYIKDSVNSNYTLQLITAPKVVPLPRVKIFNFNLLVKDRTKDAKGVLVVIDRAGNYVLDTVSYKATPLPDVTPSEYKLTVFKADTTIENTITITNPTQDTMYIASVYLNYGTAFTIKSGAINSRFALAPASSHTVTVNYKPANAIKGDTTSENDALQVVMASCRSEISVPLEGKFAKTSIRINKGSLLLTSVSDGSNGGFDETGMDTVTIVNITNSNITIESISLENHSIFTIINSNSQFPVSLSPGDTHSVIIRYFPFGHNHSGYDNHDYDTLHIKILGEAERLVYIKGQFFALDVEEGSSSSSEFSIVATPNPANESVLISLSGNYPQRVIVRLYDAIGREVLSSPVEIENGKSISLPNVAGLPIGTYRLVATSSNGLEIASRLLLIQR